MLITPIMIYLWVGKDTGSVKKAKCIDYGKRLCEQDFKNKNTLKIVESSDDLNQFKALLNDPGANRYQDLVNLDDSAFELQFELQNVLYSFEAGKEPTTASGKLSSKQLLSSCSYVLKTEDELYVWFGKTSSNEQKKDAQAFGEVNNSLIVNTELYKGERAIQIRELPKRRIGNGRIQRQIHRFRSWDEFGS
jgi:hypothetical protein